MPMRVVLVGFNTLPSSSYYYYYYFGIQVLRVKHYLKNVLLSSLFLLYSPVNVNSSLPRPHPLLPPSTPAPRLPTAMHFNERNIQLRLILSCPNLHVCAIQARSTSILLRGKKKDIVQFHLQKMSSSVEDKPQAQRRQDAHTI